METGIRINKYLSAAGVCSRREADRLIDDGQVLINGCPAVSGQKVSDEDTVELAGRRIVPEQSDPPVLIAFNKPRGIICTSGTKDGGRNIIDYIGYKSRIFPIGRLDKESEGLILLTNRGELVNAVNRARYGHEKEYEVCCKDRISEDFLRKMSSGVKIPVPDGVDTCGRRTFREAVTRKCSTEKTGAYSFRITITQGYNRQIRRMCEALGNKVISLRRIRIMNILLGDLPEGKYRTVEGEELERLESMLRIGKKAIN